MLSDVCFELAETIKEANKEIEVYLQEPFTGTYDESEVARLIEHNLAHIKYLTDFRNRPGYDLPPESTG